jgi:hypothetical protein
MAANLPGGRVTMLGNLPLIVLSRGIDQQLEWMAQQAELLQLPSKQPAALRQTQHRVC